MAKVVFLLTKVERHRQSNIERQRQYKAKKCALIEATYALDTTLEPLKDAVLDWELKMVTIGILQSINKELHFFLKPLSKSIVMQRVLTYSTVVDFVLKSTFKQSSKLVVAQNEIINGFMSTLGVVKNPCTFDKLATKHALLITDVCSMENSSILR